MVLPWCYHGVTMVLPWCYHGVTMLLPCCYRGYKKVHITLQPGYSGPKAFKAGTRDNVKLDISGPEGARKLIDDKPLNDRTWGRCVKLVKRKEMFYNDFDGLADQPTATAYTDFATTRLLICSIETATAVSKFSLLKLLLKHFYVPICTPFNCWPVYFSN